MGAAVPAVTGVDPEPAAAGGPPEPSGTLPAAPAVMFAAGAPEPAATWLPGTRPSEPAPPALPGAAALPPVPALGCSDPHAAAAPMITRMLDSECSALFFISSAPFARWTVPVCPKTPQNGSAALVTVRSLRYYHRAKNPTRYAQSGHRAKSFRHEPSSPNGASGTDLRPERAGQRTTRAKNATPRGHGRKERPDAADRCFVSAKDRLHGRRADTKHTSATRRRRSRDMMLRRAVCPARLIECDQHAAAPPTAAMVEEARLKVHPRTGRLAPCVA